MSANTSSVSKGKNNPNTRKQTECLIDLTSANVNSLGEYIAFCVQNSIDLICYSQESIKHPELSITEIPGLSTLFIQACLQQGLLGYLDWKKENHPTEQNDAIINNVIIATCGEKCEPPPDEKSKGISHTVDPEKLKLIRSRSAAKFNQIINSKQTSLKTKIPDTRSL
jgi:hypothetical protein